MQFFLHIFHSLRVQLQDVEKMVIESQKQTEELCQVEEYMKQVCDTAQDQEWQQLVLYTEQVKVLFVILLLLCVNF